MVKTKYPKGEDVDALLNDKFHKAAQELLAEELKTLTPAKNAKSVKLLKIVSQMCVNTFRDFQLEFKNGNNIDAKSFGKTIRTLSQMIGVKNHQLKKDVLVTLIG